MCGMIFRYPWVKLIQNLDLHCIFKDTSGNGHILYVAVISTTQTGYHTIARIWVLMLNPCRVFPLTNMIPVAGSTLSGHDLSHFYCVVSETNNDQENADGHNCCN